MSDPSTQQILAQLDAQRAQLSAHQAELATMRARSRSAGAGRRTPRRIVPVVVVALLVALVPLGLFAASPTFSDLGQAAPEHRGDIQAIGDVGVTTGFDDPNSADPNVRVYYPKDNVTREEMASFLARLGGLGDNPPVANALTAQTVPDRSITPAKLSADGSTAGQVLTSTGSGVTFQNPPAGTGIPGPTGPAGPSVTATFVRVSGTNVLPVAPGVPQGPEGAVGVGCATGEVATGGGYTASEPGLEFQASAPTPAIAGVTPTGWFVSARNPTAATIGLVVYAVCAPAVTPTTP